MSSSGSGVSSQAIAWALLSQMVWLPLVGIDLHDRWQARLRATTPPGRPLPPSPLAAGRPLSLNDLAGAARPAVDLAGQALRGTGAIAGQAISGTGLLLSTAGSGASSLLERPFTASLDRHSPASSRSHPSVAPIAAMAPAASALERAFSRSQLLGGSVGLGDLQEGAMSPLALVERSIRADSGDPLAPLPSLWREPMRQALLKLPGSPRRLAAARSVVVPSAHLSQPAEVPLALQSDGSIDILEAPSDPSVLRDVAAWAGRQPRPAGGSLTPALVRFQPLPDVAPLRPSAARQAPAAAGPAPAVAAASSRVSSGPSLPELGSSRDQGRPSPAAAAPPRSAPVARSAASPSLPAFPESAGGGAQAPAAGAAATVSPATVSPAAALELPAAAAPLAEAAPLTPPPPVPSSPVAP